jgi:septation ring formation regulator EzrA
MNPYWEVLNPLGKKIANTGSVDDAIRLCEMRGQGHTYRQVKFIMDQVITVMATTDKQLPGQIGLPPGQYKIVDRKIYKLEESELEPVIIDG